MIQQRSVSLLSSAERHLLRQNRAYAGQCIRCIHTSKPLRAEESKTDGNDNGTPYNAPKRGPNRQERAAKISSEVSALAADLPKANLSGRNAEVHGAQPRNQAASSQPQANAAAPGIMGQNEGPRKEGPFAQGVGRVERSSEEDPSYAAEARGVRTPNSKLETPEEGGASVMDPLGSMLQTPVSSEPNAGTVEVPAATSTSPKHSKPTASARQVSPKKPGQTPEQFLHSGSGTSVLISNNVPGLLQDRTNLLSPRSGPSTPTTAEIAYRLRNSKKQLTAFDSTAHKDSYTKPRANLQNKLEKLESELAKEKEKSGTKESAVASDLLSQILKIRKQLSKMPKFYPLPQTAQQDIINRMVLGKYDEQGLLSGKQVHKQQPLLDSIAKELLRNPTYVAKDSDKLLSKLKGLIPSAAALAAASKKKPANAKA